MAHHSSRKGSDDETEIRSAEYVRSGAEGGFAQLGHGKHDAVKALRKGDWRTYYSPREDMGTGAPVQAFTAIGRIISDTPYQAAQAMNLKPYRVGVYYLARAQPASVRPLLNVLDSMPTHADSWGLLLCGPKRRVTPEDMRRMAPAMGVLPDGLDFGG